MAEEDVMRSLFLDSSDRVAEIGADSIRSTLLHVHVSEIMNFLERHQAELTNVDAKNIPQFSNVSEVDRVLSILLDSGLQNFDFVTIGEYLCERGTKEGAQRKYGENHYKLCAQLGFTTYPPVFQATENGIAYHRETKREVKKIWFCKMILHVPIIQKTLLTVKVNDTLFSMSDYMSNYLSQSTVKRRLPNVIKLLAMLNEISDDAARVWIGRINR